MYVFIVILMVLASLLMCFIVLIQNSKGGGLAAGFSTSNAILGVRKTTDVLEKLTWGLAIFMVVMSITAAYTIPSGKTEVTDTVMQQAQQDEKTNPYNLPTGANAPASQSAPAQQSQGAANGAATGTTNGGAAGATSNSAAQ